MKKINDLSYDIKDLRIVMIDKDYIENRRENYIEYFNENIKFVVEKSVIESIDQYGLKKYSEYYTECITEQDLSVRSSNKPFDDFPKIFSIVSRIPPKFFTEEELATGKVSVMRIFKILQDINVNDRKQERREKREEKKKAKQKKLKK